MSNQTLIIGLSFLICLFLSAFFFSNFIKISYFREKLVSSALAIFLSVSITQTAIIFIFWSKVDFIGEMSAWQYLVPLLCSPLIIMSSFMKKNFIIHVFIFICSTITVFISDLTLNFIPQQYTLLNKIITIFFLWAFSVCYKNLSSVKTLPQNEGITICIGILLLYFFGQAPFILGTTTANVLAALIISFIYNSRAPLTTLSPFLGFILGWIGLISYQEYLLPCFIIFAMYYLIETLVALIHKITFLPQYKNLPFNIVTFKSIDDGLPFAMATKFIWNSNILLIILGLFQINSPNVYSIPFFAALITGWQLYRISNWRNESKTIKEVNCELANEIKSSFHKIFNKDENNTDNK